MRRKDSTSTVTNVTFEHKFMPKPLYNKVVKCGSKIKVSVLSGSIGDSTGKNCMQPSRVNLKSRKRFACVYDVIMHAGSFGRIRGVVDCFFCVFRHCLSAL